LWVCSGVTLFRMMALLLIEEFGARRRRRNFGFVEVALLFVSPART
jgi:hypothetical protein